MQYKFAVLFLGLVPVEWAFICPLDLLRRLPSMRFPQTWDILGMGWSWFICWLLSTIQGCVMFRKTLSDLCRSKASTMCLHDFQVFQVQMSIFLLSEILQQNAYTEVVGIEPQLMSRESSRLVQHTPEHQQIKVEQEELYVSQKGEQLKLKQEADAFAFISAYVGSDHGAELFEMTENHSGRKQQDSGSITYLQPKPSKMHCRSNQSKPVSSNVKCDPRVKYLGFTSKLQMHLRRNAGEKLHLCEICGKRFAYKLIRDKHVRIHAVENPYLFQTPCSLKLDLNSKTSTDEDEKSLSCPTCGKRFRSTRVLKAHLKTHSDDKPFLCHTRGERFTHSLVLKKHVTIHTGEKPYPSNTRRRRFSQPPLLESHLRVHAGEKLFLCKTCGKRFASRALLKGHAKVHTGERPYSCDICAKTFTTSSGMRSHLRIHTGEKPYICDTCGRRFSRSATLKCHLRVHTGEKPFSCEECGKCFTVRCSLLRHMSVHTGEKPFCCQECSKCFTDKNTLMRHMRVHTGEKPYACETCGKAFRNIGNLNVHIRNHRMDALVM